MTSDRVEVPAGQSPEEDDVHITDLNIGITGRGLPRVKVEFVCDVDPRIQWDHTRAFVESLLLFTEKYRHPSVTAK